MANALTVGTMQWEAIGAIGEVIGALAVIATLAFLGIQIRTNTRAVRSTSEYDIDRRWSELNFDIGRDPAYSAIWKKILDENATVRDFDDVQLAQAHHLIRGILQFYQGGFYAWKNGILPQERWLLDRDYVPGFVNLPVVRSFVNAEVSQGIFRVEFQQEVFTSHKKARLNTGIPDAP